MTTVNTRYYQTIQKEIEQVPEAYLPELLSIVKNFRDGIATAKNQQQEITPREAQSIQNDRPLKVTVAKERNIIMYSELWHASDCVLQSGISEQKGSSWQFLSSIVLRAFTFEAYLNHVGQRTIPLWEQEYDRLSITGKLDLLCTALSVQFPNGFDSRPLQTIEILRKFRNTMAHGKSRSLKKETTQRDVNDQLDNYIGERLLDHWEQLIQNSNFATQAREDIRAVISRIHEARKDQKESLFSRGYALSGARLC